MNDEQQAALERLYEDESSTDNLTDPAATALLNWAATQIKSGIDPHAVRQAMRQANAEQNDAVATVVHVAQTALAVLLPVQTVAFAQPAAEAAASAPTNVLAIDAVALGNAVAGATAAAVAQAASGVPRRPKPSRRHWWRRWPRWRLQRPKE